MSIGIVNSNYYSIVWNVLAMIVKVFYVNMVFGTVGKFVFTQNYLQSLHLLLIFKA